MAIYLLDNSLKIEIFYECIDCEYPDNITVRVTEDCPEEEKLIRADQVNLFLTPQDARKLAFALLSAAEQSHDAGKPPDE
ncbi:MAG: hypothetical protein HPY76_01635 [Anaerolineae bacterium]|nr:hypothetical protein [Anaerolineae bacterium]